MNQGVSHRCGRTASVLAAVLGLLGAASADASLVGNVTVSLIAPGGAQAHAAPINVSQAVAVSSSITYDANQSLGSFLGTDEFIRFNGDSIEVRMEAWGENMSTHAFDHTGYYGSNGQHARYVFDGLNFGLNQILASASLSTLDFDGVGTGLSNGGNAASWLHIIDGDSLSLDLDQMLFDSTHLLNSSSYHAYADFRISLTSKSNVTPPPPPASGNTVPEPSSLALVFGGLAIAGGLQRRKR